MASDESRPVSVVSWLSRENSGSCGYCSSSDGCEKHGLWGHKLTAEDYQDLIDRGWRRCGHYCYKGVMTEMCCPSYTIRCDAINFRLSRSQKRNLKRMRHFLLTGEKGKERHGQGAVQENIVNLADSSVTSHKHLYENAEVKLKERVSSEMMSCDSANIPNEIAHTDCKPTGAEKFHSETVQNKKIIPNPLKAKQLRINRKLEKLKAQGLSEDEINIKMKEKKKYPVIKTLEDFIDVPLPENAAHRLEIRLVRSSPKSDEFQKSFKHGLELFRKYQVAVHKDPPSKITKESYERFLVKSAVEAEDDFGSYHQQYWLDNELIAVGVIDILPKSVSSVYLFYNTEYAFLGLGTYGALRELHFTRTLSKRLPGLSYYYMGYYIHSCPKMRYKGAYYPSFLLCPEAYTWHPIEQCRPKLDEVKYSRLGSDLGTSSTNSTKIILADIPLLFNGSVIRVGNLTKLPRELKDKLEEYVKLVGVKSSKKMLLYLHNL